MTETTQATLLERYQRLLEISQDLASTLELDALLNRIVHAAADLCTVEAASILLYDQTKEQLYFQATSNLEAPIMRGLIVPVDSSLAGWILRKRKPVIIPDVSKDPRHFSKIGKATKITTTSLLGVPLITKDKVIGVLEAINKLSGEFSNEDLEVISALGAQAAVAIENTRLFQQSDLISELVHELSTPLASLNTASYLLLRPEVSQEQRDQILDTMQHEITRLTEMASSYLDYARLESGRTKFQVDQVHLDEVLNETVLVMRAKIEEKNQELIIDVQDNLPTITADHDKLKQVVINLVSNANKYTQTGGKITVAASVSDDEALIRVSDNGPGIPADQIPKLYERFYRVPRTERRVQGSGLGLSICKRIIEAHRGYIQVESTVGQGTIFNIHLPLIPTNFA